MPASLRSERAENDATTERARPAPVGSAGTDRPVIRVLTVNTHKGFTFLNRKFILHELRDAVRKVGADLVFLQEVHGANEKHGARVPNWPATSTTGAGAATGSWAPRPA